MRYLSEVVDEIAQELKLTSTSIERRVLTVAKTVLNRIGLQFTTNLARREFSIKKDQFGMGRFKLMDEMLLPVIDVMIEGKESSQFTFSQRYCNAPIFNITSSEIIFPNNSEGKAVVVYNSLYLSEEGELMIGDLEYNAIFQLGMYELLKKSVTDPRRSNIILYRQDADAAINEARASYNKFTKNKIHGFSDYINGRSKEYDVSCIPIRECLNC
jgi:hypothetical protein